MSTAYVSEGATAQYRTRAMAMIGPAADPLRHVFDAAQAVVFRIVAILMRAAPLGAFGAMAFTIGISITGLTITIPATSKWRMPARFKWSAAR